MKQHKRDSKNVPPPGQPRIRARRGVERAEPAGPRPQLRVVTRVEAPQARVEPPRPRWGPLYLALGLMAAGAFAAHHFIARAVLIHVADGVFSILVMLTLVTWFHVNRVRLAEIDDVPVNRLPLADTDDADAGTGQPRLRIVRGRDEPVQIPWNFD